MNDLLSLAQEGANGILGDGITAAIAVVSILIIILGLSAVISAIRQVTGGNNQ
jgi:hypothetical protein